MVCSSTIVLPSHGPQATPSFARKVSMTLSFHEGMSEKYSTGSHF